jgi:flagellar FliJ protein
MKRFLFRLEPVLGLRAAKESEAQASYGRALEAMRRAEEDLTDARMELERLEEALNASRRGRFTKNDQIIALNAIGYQQSICQRKADRLAHFQKEAQARLQDLLAAKRAREVLERLRAKQQAQYQRETERREQVAVDDAVMARFGRPKGAMV